MRVVVDTNVWISALQFKGTPLQAIEAALLADRLVICSGIEQEVFATLCTKFAWQHSQVREGLALYLGDAVRVQTVGSVQGVCRDPKDDMVLECALLGNADVLVSGDRDLLALGTFSSTRILSARAYLDLPR